MQGYGSQQYDGAADPDRPHNLYEPVDQDRDFGAHGDFDRRAHNHSLQVWADQDRDWICLAGALGSLWDALQNGPGKFWRGGLIGLTLGTLTSFGLRAASASCKQLSRSAFPAKPQAAGRSAEKLARQRSS